MRSCDLLGRIGGDELLAVLPDTKLRAACRLGRRLSRRLYATPIHTSAGSVRLGLTYGAAGLEEALAGPDLVEVADRRMLRRKQRGGGGKQPPLLCPLTPIDAPSPVISSILARPG
jgi:diguanylate cyclase (GGDEF)-like protein